MVALTQVFPSQKPDSSNAPLEGCNLVSAHFPFFVPHLPLLYRVACDTFTRVQPTRSVVVAKPDGVPRGFYKHSQAAVSNAEVDGWSNAARLARGLAPRKPATLYSSTRVQGGLADFYLPGMGL